MKRLAILFSSLLITYMSIGQGVIFNQDEFEKYDEFDISNLGFAGNLPSKYSIRKYAPGPMLQNGGSCVGWSVGFAAMSITYNIGYGITNPNHKYAATFDPYNIYSFLRDEYDYKCDDGIYIHDALKLLKTFGIKKYISPPFMECNTQTSERDMEIISNFANNYKIKEFYSLDPSNTDVLEILKEIIHSDFPIVIGIVADKSIHEVSSSGLYVPPLNFEEEFGHAMCITGYSDTKFGGSFEIMNSWGSEYGDDGFNWIKYSDFSKLIKEIWIVEPFENQFKQSTCSLGNCNGGYGIFRYSNGDRFEGYFGDDGSRNYYGIYYFDDGTAYAGFWENDNYDGPGLFFSLDGSIYNCTYENNELVSSEVLGFASDEKNIILNTVKNKIEETSEIKDAIDEGVSLPQPFKMVK